MDGGDRSGYMQISNAVDSVLITSTMGACSATGSWYKFEVISSNALIKGITAPGLANSSFISSGTTYSLGAIFACSKITIVELATGDTSGNNANSKVIAHKRILL